MIRNWAINCINAKVHDPFNFLYYSVNISAAHLPYSLLPPFLCFITNQLAHKFKLVANLITYFVNICNIY